jgi:hypothetical protein
VRISPGLTVEPVGTGAPEEQIAGGPSLQPIVPGPAVETVTTGATQQAIVAVEAMPYAGVLPARQDVAARLIGGIRHQFRDEREGLRLTQPRCGATVAYGMIGGR